KRLAVRQTLISVAYEITVTTPKSHNERVIDLDPETVEVLRAHRKMRTEEHAAIGMKLIESELVFGKADGTTIHPDVISQTFDKLVARSGVRRIRLHDLRHTHATIGLRAEVPVKVMSERLGHSTPAFTLQQYAHVIPGMQAEAAGAIADIVAESRPGPEADVAWDDEAESEEDEEET
ncbi:MAG: site-specific integrase, partial [Acidimicrobiales bacterium]